LQDYGHGIYIKEMFLTSTISSWCSWFITFGCNICCNRKVSRSIREEEISHFAPFPPLIKGVFFYFFKKKEKELLREINSFVNHFVQ
jgi:hypothetical protein